MENEFQTLCFSKKRKLFKGCLEQENKEMENKNGTHTTLPFYL